MRPAVLLALLGGCSALLGIENPQPRDDAGTDADDAAVDAPDDTGPARDRLAFNVASLRLARNQIARLHVQFIHADGTMEDVTESAGYVFEPPGIVAGGAGTIVAGGQEGTAVITASQGDAEPARLTVTVAQEQCHPVINELQTASPASANDEWVEVYNPCSGSIDVSGWTLDYRSAMNSSDVLLVTLSGLLATREIRLFAGPDFGGTADDRWTTGTLGGTNGGVGLRVGPINTSMLVDAIAYGNAVSGHAFTEGNPAPAMMSGRSGARLPFDGKDDGDGAVDISIVTTPTPRALNAP